MAALADVMVIGGGVVGTALAYGAMRSGANVLVLDGDDTDIRAARANFGLVWVQGKGLGLPEYQRWTVESSVLWPALAARLQESTGYSMNLRQNGGLVFCLGDEELEARRGAVMRMHNQIVPPLYENRVVDRAELQAMLPGVTLGPRVTGASFCPIDGDCDPLALFGALHAALETGGARVRRGAKVMSLGREGGDFVARTASESFRAKRVVIAAGHGSVALGKQVGIDVPIRPERGQILVTERLAPMLPYTASGIRQTAEGTVMIGATQEDVGFDLSTTVAQGAALAKRAVEVLPALAEARFVRTWAGLRVLTPDRCPAYVESETHPGAFLITCHSGVTLAGAHAEVLGPALARGELPERLAAFHPRRFEKDVSQAA